MESAKQNHAMPSTLRISCGALPASIGEPEAGGGGLSLDMMATAPIQSLRHQIIRPYRLSSCAPEGACFADEAVVRKTKRLTSKQAKSARCELSGTDDGGRGAQKGRRANGFSISPEISG